MIFFFYDMESRQGRGPFGPTLGEKTLDTRARLQEPFIK